jgi:RimJ/RimL family protein N-acetyltransferase
VEIVTLPSDRRVAIRPIRSDDGPRIQAAYERLTPQTKYRRFLAVKPRLTDGDAAYLTAADGRNHVALVATPADDPARIIAVARFVRLDDDPAAAELAIVVGDPYQGEGLGTELLGRLADGALARGIHRLKATMLADNVPVHRLLRHGMTRERHLGAIHEIEVELAA